MNGWYVNPVGNYTLVVGVATAFLVLLLLASRDLRSLRPRRRFTLISLRVLVFLAVVAAMLRPTYVFTEMKRHRATVLVLLDKSRSMMVADEKDKPRWNALRDTIVKALPRLRELNGDFDVKLLTFDTTTSRVPLGDTGPVELGATADGAQTALGAALADAMRKEAGHRVTAVVLLSDGGQNATEPYDMAPQSAARQLADLGVPLYTVCFGLEGVKRSDAAVVSLDAPKQTFVKNVIPIKGQVRISGYRNVDVPVEAWFEVEAGKPPILVGTQKVRAVRDGENIAVEFSYVPQIAGEHKITLRIPPQPEEQELSNNETSTYVQVAAGGLNVLYVEGEPRVEQRFLRRSLAASPDIKVDFKWFDHRNRKNWPVNVGDDFKPGKYDVYILGDIDSKAFSTEDLTSLKTAVERGAGLLLLGGFHSYWAGGYQNTPLKDIYPLEARDSDRFVRQNFDEPVDPKLHIVPPSRDKGLTMVPTKQFGGTSVMRLAAGDQANREAWQKLPGLEGANAFGPLKFAAKPLAETPDGRPMLVAAEPGAGRVLAFAGDSTWHWYMEGFEDQHKRFWRQAILWLARKEDTDKTGVWIHMAQRQFMPRRPVEFTAGATTAQGQPMNEATFEATVTAPDGTKTPARMSRVGSQSTATFRDAVAPGEYTIEVTASKDKALLGQARTRFMVYEQELEMENPGAQQSFLQSLAKITKDGDLIPPEQFDSLLLKIKQQSKDLEVPTETKSTPWDKPPFFLVIVALLIGEWFLRKRWGLV